MHWLSGVLSLSCDGDFLRKFPVVCTTFRFSLYASLPKERSAPFFCWPCIAVAELAPRSSLFGFRTGEITFNGEFPDSPFPVSLRFPFRDSPPRFPCGSLIGVVASSRETYQSFNQQTPGVLSCSCELLLAKNDFQQKYPGTYEPFNFRLFATTLKRTLSTFWLSGHHRIAPCMPKLRPICGADLATRPIWPPIQLRISAASTIFG
jgi:hypothetical protein